jgi:hypothetical protein
LHGDKRDPGRHSRSRPCRRLSPSALEARRA